MGFYRVTVPAAVTEPCQPYKRYNMQHGSVFYSLGGPHFYPIQPHNLHLDLSRGHRTLNI
jgi:hypothetical protein